VTGYTIRRVRRVFCALRLTVVSTAATGVLLVAGDPALAAPQGMDSNLTWLKPTTPRSVPRDSVRGVGDREEFTLVDLSQGATVRAWPGGPSIGWLDGATPLGYPSWVWALNTAGGGRWARVLLPWRPNGRSGWVALDGHRVERTTWSVDVDLSHRRLVLVNRGTPVAQFEAGIGAADSPTPTGRFSVTDLVATGDPGGPFGWFVLGLSGHQPNLPAGWGGGDQLAIHGTNQPSTIGGAASAGSVHVSAHTLSVLREHLQLGSPVLIHA
jgi:hypothetical protein